MVKSFIFPLLGNGNNNLCLIRFWFRLTAVVEKQLAQYQALQWTVVIVLEIQLLPRQSISVLNSSHTYMQLSFCLLELSFCLSVLFDFIMFYYFPHVHGSFFLFLSFFFFFWCKHCFYSAYLLQAKYALFLHLFLIWHISQTLYVSGCAAVYKGHPPNIMPRIQHEILVVIWSKIIVLNHH